MEQDDYRKDPDYQNTRNNMFRSAVSGTVWGVIAAVAAIGAVAVAPLAGAAGIIGAIALGIVAVASAYKSWQAGVDERVGLEKANADFTAQSIARTAQPQMAPEMPAMPETGPEQAAGTSHTDRVLRERQTPRVAGRV